MAKGKHAVALFEVISKDKRFIRSRRGSTALPIRAKRKAGWSRLTQWFRKRADEPFATKLAPLPADPVPNELKATIIPGPAPVVMKPQIVEQPPLAQPPITQTPVAEEPFYPRTRAEYADLAGTSPEARPATPLPMRMWVPDEEPAPAAAPPPPQPATEPFREHVTRDEAMHAQPVPFAPLVPGRPHKTITIPITPASVGIISACAAVLVIGVALTRQPKQASGLSLSALTAQQVRQGPAHPDVMNLRDAGKVPNAMPARPGSSHPAAQASAGNPPTTPTALAVDGKRQVNLNYVLIQSYADQKQASDACNLLNTNGVPCTIEQNIKGWRSDWYLVIGTTGFAHIKTPEFAAYLKQIDAASRKFSSNPKGFKAFDPQPIKWVGP